VGPDLGVIFDSNDFSEPEDRDLQGPSWSGGGNLAIDADNTVLDKLLIIQEDGFDDGGVISTDPDDEGSRPAGSIYFDFNTAIDSFGFDLVDVEGPTEFGHDSGYSAAFFDMNGVELARVGFGDFITNGDPFFDSTVGFGDNSANRISPITAAALGVNPFSRVEINLGGSAAVDNITYTVAVPLPSAAFAGFGLLGGLGGVSRWQKRRLAAA